ncbi:DUF6456 domain-containing protein [Parasphingorhabdus sp.]|uniref:DUF6456 domain-containing protein n=1 Tax=Parasphingorhabdus sp. TaxID=2709688 RepID=UPI003264E205
MTLRNVQTADPRILVEKPVPQDGRDRAGSNRDSRPARSVTVNLAESPLGWLHARGHLSDRQLDGGEKLRSDWDRANLEPSITMSWNLTPMSGGKRSASDHLNQTEARLAAKQRFDDAIFCLGKDLSDIAWRVICAGEGVPVAEKSLGWPARSGKIVLRIALDRLADHYRLPG